MDVLFIVVGILLLMVLISTYFALAHYEAHKEAINSDVVAEPELITEAVPPDITNTVHTRSSSSKLAMVEEIREEQLKHRQAFRDKWKPRIDAAFKPLHDSMDQQLTEIKKQREALKEITAEDSWQQILILEDQVHDLITRMDDLRIKDGRPVCDAVDDLRAQLGFHVERISDDMHVEDIDVYDWIAARDPEFANKCKVSYRYGPNGKLKDEYGTYPRYIKE
jgi:hypothetical protein